MRCIDSRGDDEYGFGARLDLSAHRGQSQALYSLDVKALLPYLLGVIGTNGVPEAILAHVGPASRRCCQDLKAENSRFAQSVQCLWGETLRARKKLSKKEERLSDCQRQASVS